MEWRDTADKLETPRARRERNQNSLLLCGHGISLRIDKGTLLIRDGVTHYPQERAEHRLFRGSLDLPPRILVLDGSGGLTFDVLDWLNEQGIPLIRIAWDGSGVIAVGGSGYSADPKIALWQREVRRDEKRRTRFMLQLAKAKFEAALKCLEDVIPASPARTSAVVVMQDLLQRIRTAPPKTTDALRVLEGRAGTNYFRAWRGITLDWKAGKRYPIPPEWKEGYSTRTSPANRGSYDNQKATHPINAMLNYAYAVLQTHLQLQAIADGYDPTLGVMHRIKFENPAFVFDLMEPMRPVVDAAILGFALANTFSGADFMLRPDGVCRLNPQLARRVAQVASQAVAQSSITETAHLN